MAMLPNVVKKTAADVIKEWAAGLTPQNAPGIHEKGPLAWVREVKVPELLEQLKALK